MNIKQTNISETDTGFRTSGCSCVCIQVVPPDPKVDELATRSTFINDGRISKKLYTLFPAFCSYRERVSQSNEKQVYVDHNNISVTFPPMVHPVIEDVYTKSNFHPPISKPFYRPKRKTNTHCARIKHLS